MSGTALLVVDVQEGFIDGQFAVYQAAEMLKRIKGLIQSARDAGIPVIYVQHDEALEYDGLIHPAIAPTPEDTVIHKLVPSAFHETPLQETLRSQGIDHLVIAGFSTDVCINATSRKAHELGYTVTLVEDAHSTIDGEDEDAPSIIKRYSEAFGTFARLVPADSVPTRVFA